MINTETVLIIGAGASAPYGYPTGKRLRHLICKNYSERVFPFIEKSKDKFARGQIQRMKNDIKNLAEVFFNSGTPSIDLFLSRNSSFSEIGKCIILSIILGDEKRSKFFEDISNVDDADPDWYLYLYQRMTSELTKQDGYKMFGKNRISFITFNYDRSLEYFIAKCLKHSFFEELKDFIKLDKYIPFNFIHVYGCVARLPWQSEESLGYREGNDFELIKRLSNNIRVIYERTDGRIEEAKELIRNAKKICFLGFGYAKENLEVLGLPDILDTGQHVYGTAKGFTKKERTRIVRLLTPKSKGSIQNPDERITRRDSVWVADFDCHRLLREWL